MCSDQLSILLHQSVWLKMSHSEFTTIMQMSCRKKDKCRCLKIVHTVLTPLSMPHFENYNNPLKPFHSFTTSEVMHFVWVHADVENCLPINDQTFDPIVSVFYTACHTAVCTRYSALVGFSKSWQRKYSLYIPHVAERAEVFLSSHLCFTNVSLWLMKTCCITLEFVSLCSDDMGLLS